MRIKWIIVGIGSILLGIVSFWNARVSFETCAYLKSLDVLWRSVPDNFCESPNSGDISYSVFLTLGIILLVVGILKKSPQSTDYLQQN